MENIQHVLSRNSIWYTSQYAFNFVCLAFGGFLTAFHHLQSVLYRNFNVFHVHKMRKMSAQSREFYPSADKTHDKSPNDNSQQESITGIMPSGRVQLSTNLANISCLKIMPHTLNGLLILQAVRVGRSLRFNLA